MRAEGGIDLRKIAQGEKSIQAAGHRLREPNLAQAPGTEFGKIIVIIDMKYPDGVSRQELHEVRLKVFVYIVYGVFAPSAYSVELIGRCRAAPIYVG
jgi:hypothetical protein